MIVIQWFFDDFVPEPFSRVPTLRSSWRILSTFHSVSLLHYLTKIEIHQTLHVSVFFCWSLHSRSLSKKPEILLLISCFYFVDGWPMCWKCWPLFVPIYSCYAYGNHVNCVLPNQKASNSKDNAGWPKKLMYSTLNVLECPYMWKRVSKKQLFQIPIDMYWLHFFFCKRLLFSF